MTDAPSERPTVPLDNPIVVEHRRLGELIHQVTHAHHLGELLRRLKEFRALLLPHFAFEETPGGFFDLVTSRSGRYLATVDDLRREHARLLRDVDVLAERARTVVMGPVAEVLQQAADLARRLEQHERRETDLLGEALYGDSGQGD